MCERNFVWFFILENIQCRSSFAIYFWHLKLNQYSLKENLRTNLRNIHFTMGPNYIFPFNNENLGFWPNFYRPTLRKFKAVNSNHGKYTHQLLVNIPFVISSDPYSPICCYFMEKKSKCALNCRIHFNLITWHIYQPRSDSSTSLICKYHDRWSLWVNIILGFCVITLWWMESIVCVSTRTQATWN